MFKTGVDMRWLVFAAPLAAVMAMSGCNKQENKTETICLNIVKSVDEDPSNISINEITTISGKLKQSDIDSYFSGRHHDGMTDSMINLKGLREKYINDGENIFSTIDYTTKNIAGGPLRDKAVCHYIKWDKVDTELIAFSIRNQDVAGDNMISFFIRTGKPKFLSNSYTIK